MSTIKGQLSKNSADVRAVTTSENGDKVSLDVSITGGTTSSGSGTGTELAGENALASGSLLYGLEWKAFEKQADPSPTQELFHYFSDPDKTNLISIITVTYSTVNKTDVIEAKREDQ